jgi:hypothetical protein
MACPACSGRIESVHDTLKGQLDLELHGGRSTAGVAARVAQRLLARPPRSGTTKPPDTPSPDP